MISNLIYALVIVGQNGAETTTAHFSDRRTCLTEAAKVIEQGPTAYCVPHTEMTQEYINSHLDKMISTLNHIRNKMESQ